MEKLVIFLAIAICGTNSIHFDETKSSRISNGHMAAFSAFPYTISLQRIETVVSVNRGHRCGGALFTFQHALTAASCLYDENFVLIPAAEYRVFSGADLLSPGTLQTTYRFIANFTVHPEYIHAPAYINNIAVITLHEPFSNATIRPIGLPPVNSIPAEFTSCSIASWGAPHSGALTSNNLLHTSKYVSNQDDCRRFYSEMAGHLNIFPSMICAASYDIISTGCFGDEGTALVCNNVLTGILFKTNMCASTSFPEVYTRVSNYTAWIRNISGSSTFRPELTFFGILVIAIAMLINKA